jgi:tRNA modification GTPase
MPPDASDAMPLVVRPGVIGGSLRLDGIASPLPCDVYLWPDGRSYTGQPVAEIHTLGSGPLLEAVLRTLCAGGARLAEPGEFTLRAFLAGRIDLTQAEAVLGVIDAAEADQLGVALAQLAGGLAGPLGRLRDGLVDLLAHLEAGFDFADEDLPFITPQELTGQLGEAAQRISELSRQMASRCETVPVVRAVLVGWPNVGKSSLFNALSRRAGALVSEHPGTTRDYLTAELDLDGVKCQLIDTAGMGPEEGRPVAVGDGSHNSASHSIEEAARAAAAEQSRLAHVRILCIESPRPPNDWERGQLEQAAGNVHLVALTKIDLGSPDTRKWHTAVPTSSMTGEGIDRLRDELRDAVLTAGACGAEAVAGTAVRCRESLRLAGESLQRARQIVLGGSDEELVAAELRVALDELGKVVGAVYTDDVLDRIFSRFCIGK